MLYKIVELKLHNIFCSNVILFWEWDLRVFFGNHVRSMLKEKENIYTTKRE